VRNENTGSGTGLCLEVHDLAVIAGREKDCEFLAGLLGHRLVDPALVRQRLAETPIASEVRKHSSARWERLIVNG
jgi:hypothetical protein